MRVQSHPVEHSKVRAAEGVALLHDGKYKAAARRFTEVHPPGPQASGCVRTLI